MGGGMQAQGMCGVGGTVNAEELVAVCKAQRILWEQGNRAKGFRAIWGDGGPDVPVAEVEVWLCSKEKAGSAGSAGER